MCMHVEAREQKSILPQSLSMLFSDMESLTGLELPKQARVTSQRTSELVLSLPLQD